MAVTLAHLAKIETEPLRKYVIVNLLDMASMMEVIPWAPVDSLTSIAVRWRTLPDVAFRKIGGSYTASEGDTEQVWESVYALGGEINLDRVFKKIKNTITDLRKLQTDMKLKALAYKFNDYLVNGDHASDPDGFEGLKKRISNMPTRQSVYFGASGAAALDPTASAANARVYLDKLEEMHYKTNEGQHNAWIVNEGIKYGMGKVLRYLNSAGGNILDVTKDSFDRSVPTLYGSPIINIGFKKDQSTLIIPENEVAGDSGTDATSLYCVALNEQQGISGIQLDELEVYDPLAGGEQESTPANIIRVEWWLGLAGFGSYGAVRGQNVESAVNWS